MSVAKAAKLILSLVDDVSKPAKGIVSAIERVNAQVAAIDRQLPTVGRNLVAASAQLIAFGYAVSNPVRAAMRFEDAMADVAKVVDASPDQLAQLKADILELTKTVPLAAEELGAIAAAAGQANVAVEDLAGFTRLVAEAATAWGMSAEAAGENLAKIRSQLGLTNEDTALLADAINETSNRTAASASDLTDYLRRVGSVGRQYGLTAEQSLAFGAAMVASGAQSEVAATSFRNMGRALTRGASATKAQSQAYRQLGLEVEDVAKRMQEDAVGTIETVFERIRQLPREVQASVLSDLFGDEARALAPLVENAELLAHALGIVADRTEYAGSVSEEFAKRSETTSSALALLGNKARVASIAFGEALLPRLRTASGALGSLADRAAAFISANKQLVANVTTLVGGLLSLRVAALAGSYGLLFAKRELLLAAGGALKLGAALKAITVAPVLAGLTRARMAMVGFAAAASIAGSSTAFSMAAKGIGKSALALVNPLNLASVAGRGLVAALRFTGVGLVLTAVGAAAAWVASNFEGLKQMAAGIGEGFSAALGPIAETLEPVTSAIGRVVDAVKDLLSPVDASSDSWRAWGVAIGESVGGAVRTTVEGVQSLIDRITAFGQSVAELPAKVGALADNAIAKISELATAAQEFGGALYNAGMAMVQSLWDGAVAKFQEFIAWVKEIPSKIVAAIGRIDLSGLIRWPSMPYWLGGGSEPAPAPAAASTAPAPAIAGKRAAGGPVSQGLTYLVGEEGPELFTPNRSGNITSNADLAGASAAGSESSSANLFTGGPITINMSPTFNIPAAVTEARVRTIARSVVKELTDALERQLTRSTQISFAGVKIYGDV